MDTTDQRYLNYAYAPILQSVNYQFQVDMYNDTLFSTPSLCNISTQWRDQPSTFLDTHAFKPHFAVNKDTTDNSGPTETIVNNESSKKLSLSEQIENSNHSFSLSNMFLSIQYEQDGI